MLKLILDKVNYSDGSERFICFDQKTEGNYAYGSTKAEALGQYILDYIDTIEEMIVEDRTKILLVKES